MKKCEPCGLEFKAGAGFAMHSKSCAMLALAERTVSPIKWGLLHVDAEDGSVSLSETFQLEGLSEPGKYLGYDTARNRPKILSLGLAMYQVQIEDISEAAGIPVVRSGASEIPKASPTIMGALTRPNGDRYLPRLIKQAGITDIDLAVRSRAAGIPVLFYGVPGTGKTALAEAAFGEELLTVSGSGDTEVSDFVGAYTQKPDGRFEWVDGPLVRAMEGGKPLLVDEIALIDTRVLAVLYSAMDGRGVLNVTANPERGTVRAADGFYVLAATNPNVPGAVMSEALLSRFRVQVEIIPSYDTAKDLGVPAKALLVARNLRKKCASGEILRELSLRDLLAFKTLSETFGEQFALSNMLGQMDAGDQPIVAEVVKSVFGLEVSPLTLE